MKVVTYHVDNKRYGDKDLVYSDRNGNGLQPKPLFATTVNNSKGEVVRYFSSIDCEIYFINGSNEFFIDDVTQLTYSVSQNTLPLFGYNSYTYDDLALGNRIISGQFAINFTSSGFLFDVLSTLKTERTVNVENSDKKFAYEHAPLWDGRFDIVISYGNNKKSGPNDIEVKPSTVLTLTDLQITSCAQQFDYSGDPICEVYSFIAKDYKTENYSK